MCWFSCYLSLFLSVSQPFDETGRRISSVLSSTIGLRLFSELDDGTGHTAVEQLLDTWQEEGVENSSEILQVTHSTLIYAPYLACVHYIVQDTMPKYPCACGMLMAGLSKQKVKRLAKCCFLPAVIGCMSL